MKMMVRYEWKKVFAKTSSKIALLLLAAVVGVTCYLAMDVYYVNENGVRERGPAAVSKLKNGQKEWSGLLDEAKVKRVIEENRRIKQSPQARSKDYKENDIAYGWGQGIEEIRNLLNSSYAVSLQEYDYYRADSLKGEDAPAFYTNRTKLLEKWLADRGEDIFTGPEKDFLISRYKALETPFYYDYMKGWDRLLEYSPTIIMITMLILGYLVAGIFSNEFQWKTDAVFFASVYGRDKAVAAKVRAGIYMASLIYWAAFLLYTGAVLLYLGWDGAACPIQAGWFGWKSFYNIKVWQEYVLTALGGFIGCLFISLLTMLVSAKTRSAVLAVMVPFILIFIPSFLGNINSPVINKILGLLPDRLLQMSSALKVFDLYQIGPKVIGAVPILLVLYGALSILLFPVIYREYRHKQIS